MDSFHQLIELVRESSDRYKEFVNSNFDLTVEQSFMNYCKSIEFCKDMQKRLDAVEIRKDGIGYGYDNCVYYMAKDILNMHEYLALLIFTSSLRKKLSESTKQKRNQNGSKAYDKHGRQGRASKPEQMPETRTK